jgi:hypothetical protein
LAILDPLALVLIARARVAARVGGCAYGIATCTSSRKRSECLACGAGHSIGMSPLDGHPHYTTARRAPLGFFLLACTVGQGAASEPRRHAKRIGTPTTSRAQRGRTVCRRSRHRNALRSVEISRCTAVPAVSPTVPRPSLGKRHPLENAVFSGLLWTTRGASRFLDQIVA